MNDLFGPRMHTFMGLRVIEHSLPPVPKIQISPKFKWCTPEFRAEYNAWLRGRFGTEEITYMISGPFGPVLLMDPKRAVVLRNTRYE